jgi:hypothetical protein
VAKDRDGASDPYVVLRYGSSRVRFPFLPSFLSLLIMLISRCCRSPLRPFTNHSTLSGAMSTLHPSKVPPVKRNSRSPSTTASRSGGRGLKLSAGTVTVSEASTWAKSAWGWRIGGATRGRRRMKSRRSVSSTKRTRCVLSALTPCTLLTFFCPQPVWHTLRSTRSRATVSGELLVQVGFVPSSGNGKNLSPEQRERIYQSLERVASEIEGARRASKEERVLLTAPVRTILSPFLLSICPDRIPPLDARRRNILTES